MTWRHTLLRCAPWRWRPSPACPRAPRPYPSRPIRVVIGYVPGGAVDITMRILAPRLGALLGQPLVIDNRPGGAGNLANEIVAQSPADG